MSTLATLPVKRSVRKLLLYSHDTYGLGHIRRNVAIARHLLGRDPSLQIVLVSGSPVSDRFALPSGLNLVRLPPVVKVGPDAYRPQDSRLSIGLVRRARSAIVADVARRLRPDVVLVDHAPAGMGGELREVFDLLARDRVRPRLALGLRDVLDEPEAVIETWSRQGVYRLLDEVYDELYVYGQRDVLDIGAAYRMPSHVAERLQYCGYLDKPSAPAADVPRIGGRFVLATAGGGGDGVDVLAAALDAGGRLGLETLIVAGPLMEARPRAVLDARAAATPRARVLSFHPSLGGLMSAASAVVTMGGYNSMCEAVASGSPTVVVPRVWPRREQAIRADLFAARGLVEVVPGGPGLADRVALVLRRLLQGPPRPRAELDLGGLDRLADGLLGGGRVREPLPVREEVAV